MRVTRKILTQAAANLFFKSIFQRYSLFFFGFFSYFCILVCLGFFCLFFFCILVCLVFFACFFFVFLTVCFFPCFFCILVCLFFFFACFFCILVCLFFCLFFFKLKIYILIQIRLCGQVGDKKTFTRPISRNKTTFFWPYRRENCRSSHQRCSVRKCVLRNCAKYTGKHLCQSLFFKKRCSPQACNFIKDGCFQVNLAKFIRTPFLQNTSRRLLLELTHQDLKQCISYQ